MGITVIGVQCAVARTFYKWVDESGTTHYSESLPETVKLEDSERLDLNDDYTTSVSEQDYYSIQNQLERIQAQRKQLLERRLLREQAKQVSRPGPSVSPPEIQTEISPVYRSYFPIQYRSHAIHSPCYTTLDCGPTKSTGHHHAKPANSTKPDRPVAFNNTRKD